MDVDLTNLLETIILVIIAPFIPILANRIKRWLDASVSRERQAVIIELVRLAVLATEQAGLAGPEAKAHAVSMAGALLQAQGLNIDVDRLAAITEAMVMEEFNKWKTTLDRDERAI